MLAGKFYAILASTNMIFWRMISFIYEVILSQTKNGFDPWRIGLSSFSKDAYFIVSFWQPVLTRYKKTGLNSSCYIIYRFLLLRAWMKEFFSLIVVNLMAKGQLISVMVVCLSQYHWLGSSNSRLLITYWFIKIFYKISSRWRYKMIYNHILNPKLTGSSWLGANIYVLSLWKKYLIGGRSCLFAQRREWHWVLPYIFIGEVRFSVPVKLLFFKTIFPNYRPLF